MPQQTGGMVGKEGIELSGQNIYNNNSRLIAEDGPLTLQAQNTFDNTRALVTSGADASIQVGGTYYNNYATTGVRATRYRRDHAAKQQQRYDDR